ncbi:anti-repressor SinI family protein [Bacillus marasmi]|nr:anti-repressor SinI family protein [Bacillus marasmi]
MTTHLKSIEELDIEWVQLILEALDLGIDKEEIRLFLQEKKVG